MRPETTGAMLLNKAVAWEKANSNGTWRLSDLNPMPTVSETEAVSRLELAGMLARVPSGPCRWRYKVTDAGREAVRTGGRLSEPAVPVRREVTGGATAARFPANAIKAGGGKMVRRKK